MHSTIVDLLKNLEDEGVDLSPPPGGYVGISPQERGDLSVIHLTNDNGGWFVLQIEDIRYLGGLGYRAEGDVLYHPDHWRPAAADEMNHDAHGPCFVGLDGAVVPLTPEAVLWGKKRRLW